MNGRVRVGLVGHGRWATGHLLTGLFAAGADVVGIAGRDVERADAVARTMGAGIGFECLEDLIAATAPDAIVIASPPAAHREHTETALRAGMPVFCEKPLGLNAAETAATLVTANGRPGLVGFTLRWHETFREVRAVVREGHLGALRHVELDYRSPLDGSPRATGNWHHDAGAEPAGVLADLGSHAIDLLRWIVGEFAAVRALGRTTIEQRPSSVPGGGSIAVRNIDVVSLQAEFDEGATAVVSCSRVAPSLPAASGVRMTLSGSRGWAYVDLAASTDVVFLGPDDDMVRRTPAVRFDDIARQQMTDLVSLVRGGDRRADLPELADGHRVQLVLDAAMESISTGSSTVPVG